MAPLPDQVPTAHPLSASSGSGSPGAGSEDRDSIGKSELGEGTRAAGMEPNPEREPSPAVRRGADPSQPPPAQRPRLAPVEERRSLMDQGG
eukprot:4531468-Pyramimonas_sp.AAC.1